MTESIGQVQASRMSGASTTRRVRGQTWKFTRPQNLSAAGNPAVTAPSVCQTCYGDQVLVTMRPCPGCCCEFCGQPTDTPPECASCQIAEDVAATRRSG